MSIANKYSLMRDSGSSPKEVYLALKSDGFDQIDRIRLLRELFQMSLMQAKEIHVIVDLGVDSLAEYQEQIFPIVIKAIEITDAEDAETRSRDEETD